jgi:hypothetical protein
MAKRSLLSRCPSYISNCNHAARSQISTASQPSGSHILPHPDEQGTEPIFYHFDIYMSKGDYIIE